MSHTNCPTSYGCIACKQTMYVPQPPPHGYHYRVEHCDSDMHSVVLEPPVSSFTTSYAESWCSRCARRPAYTIGVWGDGLLGMWVLCASCVQDTEWHVIKTVVGDTFRG